MAKDYSTYLESAHAAVFAMKKAKDMGQDQIEQKPRPCFSR